MLAFSFKVDPNSIVKSPKEWANSTSKVATLSPQPATPHKAVECQDKWDYSLNTSAPLALIVKYSLSQESIKNTVTTTLAL